MFRNFLQALASGVTAVLGCPFELCHIAFLYTCMVIHMMLDVSKAYLYGGRDTERPGPQDDFEHVGETMEGNENLSTIDASLAEEAAAVDSHNTSGTCVDTKRRKVIHVDEAWEKIEKETVSLKGAQPATECISNTAAHGPSFVGEQSELSQTPSIAFQDISLVGEQNDLSTSAFEEIQVPQKEGKDQNPDLNSSGSIEVISRETMSEVKVSMTDTVVITDSMILTSTSIAQSDDMASKTEKFVQEGDTKTAEEEEVFEDSFENLELVTEAAGNSDIVKAKKNQDRNTNESQDNDVTESQVMNAQESQDKDVTETQDINTHELQDRNTTESLDKDVTESQNINAHESQDRSATESQNKNATETQDINTHELQDRNTTELQDKDVTETQEKNATQSKEKDTEKDEGEIGRRDRDSHKSIQREEGENYLDFVRRKTEAHQLIFAKKLIYQLGYLTDISAMQLEEAVKEQYKVAVERKCVEWIKDCRYHGEILFSRKWLDENVPVLGRKGKQTEWKQRKSRSTYRSEWSYKPGEMCRDVRLEKDPNLPVYRANAATKAGEMCKEVQLEKDPNLPVYRANAAAKAGEDVDTEDVRLEKDPNLPVYRANAAAKAGEDVDTEDDNIEKASEELLKKDLLTSNENKEDLNELPAEGDKESRKYKKCESKVSENEVASSKNEGDIEKRLEDPVGERKEEMAVKDNGEKQKLSGTAQAEKKKSEDNSGLKVAVLKDENKNNNCIGMRIEDDDDVEVKGNVTNITGKKTLDSVVKDRESFKQSSTEELEKETEIENRVFEEGKIKLNQNAKEVFSHCSTLKGDKKEQKDLDHGESCKSDDEKKAEEKIELDKAKWNEAMDGWIQATRKGRKARSRGTSENEGQLASPFDTVHGDGKVHSSSNEIVSDDITDYESLLANWKKDSEKHKLKKRNSDSGGETLVKTPSSVEKKPRTFVSKTIHSPNSPISYAAAVTGDSPPKDDTECKEQIKEDGAKNSSYPVNLHELLKAENDKTCSEHTGMKSNVNENSSGGKEVEELQEISDEAGQIADDALKDAVSKEKQIRDPEIRDSSLDVSDVEKEVSKLVDEITARVLAEAETATSVHEKLMVCGSDNEEVRRDSKDIPFEDSAIISGGRELSSASESEGMSLPVVSLEKGAEESEISNSPEEYISLLQQVMPNVSLLSGMKLEHTTRPVQMPMSKVIVQEDLANCVDIGDLSVAENVEVGEDGALKAHHFVVEKAVEEVGREDTDIDECSSPGVILSSEMHHYSKTESANKGVEEKTRQSKTVTPLKNGDSAMHKSSSKSKEKPNTVSGKVPSAHSPRASCVPVPYGKSSRVSYTPGKGSSHKKPSIYDEKGKRKDTEKLRKNSGPKEQLSSGKPKTVVKEEARLRNRSGEDSSKYVSGVGKSDALRKKSSSSLDKGIDGKGRKESSSSAEKKIDGKERKESSSADRRIDGKGRKESSSSAEKKIDGKERKESSSSADKRIDGKERKESSSFSDRSKEGKERKDSLKGRSANDYPGSPHLRSTFSSRMKAKDTTDKQSDRNNGNQAPIVERDEQKVVVSKEILSKKDKKVDAKEKLHNSKPCAEKNSSFSEDRNTTTRKSDDTNRDKPTETETKSFQESCFVRIEKLSMETVQAYTTGKKEDDDGSLTKSKGCTDMEEDEASKVVLRRKSDPLVEKTPFETILNVSNLIELIKEKENEISLIKHGHGQRIIGGKMLRKKSISESELDTVFGRLKRKGDMNIRRSSLSTAFKSLKELKQSVNIGRKSETYGLHKRRGSLLYTLEQDYGSPLYEIKTAKELVKHKEDVKEAKEMEVRKASLNTLPSIQVYNSSQESQNLADIGKEVHIQEERLKEKVMEHSVENYGKTDINSNRLRAEQPISDHIKESTSTSKGAEESPYAAKGCLKSKSKPTSKIKTATSSSGAKAKVTNVKASRKHQWRQSKK